jgi:hypothetical protein
MFGLRRFIGSRRSSRLLALGIAYSLAIQAIMASVGLGMSGFAGLGPDGLVICSHAAAGGPAPAGDRRNPGSSPPCPFCYVAAQSAGHIALANQGPSIPIDAGLLWAPVSDRFGGKGFIPQFRRMVGAPRAPPAFSV